MSKNAAVTKAQTTKKDAPAIEGTEGFTVEKLAPNDRLAKLREEKRKLQEQLKEMREAEKAAREAAEAALSPEEKATKEIRKHTRRIDKLVKSGDLKGIDKEARSILSVLEKMPAAKK